MVLGDMMRRGLSIGHDPRRVCTSRRLALEPLEARTLLTLQGNTLFPADNPWNQQITNAPVAANSATLVGSIGASSPLHPDFGTVYQGANIGIPYNVVSGTQPKVNVVVDAYADESDLVPVPIPAGAVIEGDPLPTAQNTGDRHLIVYDQDHNIAYELFNVHRPSEESDGQWHADSEAVWDMSRDSFRTPGNTSADAAGLPILPGLVRPDEVLDQGVIRHALRFTVPRSRDTYVFPASHEAGVNNASYPPMGERFRLKQSFDISGFSATDRVILQALKDYGMIVADNGSSWFLSGSPSSRWNDDDLHALTQVLGSNFEAVDLTPRVTSLDQSTGSTAGGTQVTIRGQNFSGAAGMLQVLFGTTPATQVSVQSDGVLMAVAPAHSAGTVDVRVQSPYGTSPTSSADHFTFGASGGVQGVHLFYRGSTKWDVTSAGFSDDNAIAPDKTAYLSGSGASTFTNVSSYSKGINGLMVDLAGPHGAIKASDFVFKVGNNNSPNLWAAAPAPTLVTTRAGAGAGGSDRVELAWADGAIQKTWLEVEVRGNDALGGSDTNTALASTYVFFLGSAPGDSGSGDSGGYSVTSADEISARNDPHGAINPATISNVNDFDRDGQVTSSDQIIARNNGTGIATQLTFLNVGASGPFAPEATQGAAGGDAGMASALARVQTSGSSPPTPGSSLPASPISPHEAFELRQAYFHHLGRIATTTRDSDAIQFDDSAAPDDENEHDDRPRLM